MQIWYKIVPFQYLQVTYKSLVDWKWTTDRLHCNPSFHGHERYDHVKEGNNHFFACLLHLFQITVGTQSHAFAYVKTYGRPQGAMQRKDKDLGIYQLQLKISPYQIISLDSVVRGALIVQDPENSHNYLIVDTIDTDMFLRMKMLVF